MSSNAERPHANRTPFHVTVAAAIVQRFTLVGTSGDVRHLRALIVAALDDARRSGRESERLCMEKRREIGRKMARNLSTGAMP